jgi:excisionase family DNA binding protein
MQKQPLLGSGDAARLLGVSRQTLLRAAKRGDIRPAFRTPRGFFRFRAEDVASYAESLVGLTGPATAYGEPSKATRVANG